jgi:hypothetical protein
MEEPTLSQEHLERIFTLIEQTPTIELFDETFMLGSYTYAQMRQAIYQQAKNLTSSGSIDGGVSQISKPLSGKTQGFIQLMLDDDSVWAEEQDRRGAMVTLTFYQTSGRPNTVFYQMNPLVEMKVPGAEPVYSLLYRFWDARKSQIYLALYSLRVQKHADLD